MMALTLIITTMAKYMKSNNIFVYGTLRKGGNNNSLLRNEKFIGSGKTKNLYSLYTAGIPYLNPNEEVCQIVGEVYEVNEDTFMAIDMLEGHPRWYYRYPAEIVLENGTDTIAWVYFNNHKTNHRLDDGDYIKYINSYDKSRISQKV